MMCAKRDRLFFCLILLAAAFIGCGALGGPEAGEATGSAQRSPASGGCPDLRETGDLIGFMKCVGEAQPTRGMRSPLADAYECFAQHTTIGGACGASFCTERDAVEQCLCDGPCSFMPRGLRRVVSVPTAWLVYLIQQANRRPAIGGCEVIYDLAYCENTDERDPEAVCQAEALYLPIVDHAGYCTWPVFPSSTTCSQRCGPLQVQDVWSIRCHKGAVRAEHRAEVQRLFIADEERLALQRLQAAIADAQATKGASLDQAELDRLHRVHADPEAVYGRALSRWQDEACRAFDGLWPMQAGRRCLPDGSDCRLGVSIWDSSPPCGDCCNSWHIPWPSPNAACGAGPG